MPEKKGRGRPRPVDTVERDERVYEALSGEQPRGRQELADEFGTSLNIIYMSLTRLRKQGRVHIVRSGKYHLWTQTYRV